MHVRVFAVKKFERQSAIAKIVKGRNYVLIADIVESLQVSESTVRRDIQEMEEKGLLLRSQGAVLWNDDRDQHHMELVYYRQIQNIDKKKQLGAFAAGMIHSGDTLFIDAGTTMLELVRQIPDIPLTVVTNDLCIALELENKFNVTTVVLGGYIRRGTHTLIGSLAQASLDGFFFEKAFFSPGGITRENGFMFFNLHAMDVRKILLKTTRQIIAVADSSKFDKPGFVRGYTFEQCGALVTDALPPGWKEYLDGRLEVLVSGQP